MNNFKIRLQQIDLTYIFFVFLAVSVALLGVTRAAYTAEIASGGADHHHHHEHHHNHDDHDRDQDNHHDHGHDHHRDHSLDHHHNHEHADDQSDPLSSQRRASLPQELANDEEEQLYTCAMHPQVRTTDPNSRCPICGMALIPVKSEDLSPKGLEAPDGIRLNERAMALMAIRTEPVTRRALEAELRLPGRITVDESRRRTISARIDGRLERLQVNTTGTKVSRGAPLAQLYSPDLLVLQQELLQAAELKSQAAGNPALQSSADDNYRAAREKLRLLGLSSEAIEAIERRAEVSEQLTIEAPVDGVVLEQLINEGDYVSTGQPLYRVVDLSKVWAQLEAYETDLPYLNLDQEVNVTLTARAGETLPGRVTYIEPWIDEQRRTARVRVELDNPEGKLKPGMLAQAKVHSRQPPILAIPISAPLLTGERALVYVRQAGQEGVFVPRQVILGARAGGYYPVLDGLDEGEQVVVNGALRLDSERQIRGMSSMMAPEGDGAPTHDHGGHGLNHPSGEQPGSADRGGRGHEHH